MGQPAARIGDTTAHGGVIVAGEPTVLIGGMPAARLGDMHTCPIPGAPPPPHVGGPIILGSFTVLIGGKPAARVGDMCTCTGPPDSIVMGCTTVLIGDGGGGGGAGMAGKGGKKGEGEKGAEAGKSKELTDSSGAEDKAEAENHYLDVKFKDKGGKEISGVAYKIKDPDNLTDQGNLYGKVKKTGVKPGSHEIELNAITKAEWSKKKARNGETVKMLVETAGIEDGTEAKFEIYERNVNNPDQCIETIDNLSVSDDKLEAEWEYFYEEDLPVADNIADDDWEVDEDASDVGDRGYYAPSYFFVVTVGTCSARSPILEYKDFIELSLCDDDDQPAANALFRVFLSNGEVREGNLDGNGYKKVENVPPGKWRVEFPDYGTVDED